MPEIVGIARTPRTSVRSSSGSPRDPVPGPFAASSSSGGRQAAGTILVFDDLRDGAHRALLDAVTASDARLLVHDLGSAADHFQDLLRASVDADAATDAEGRTAKEVLQNALETGIPAGEHIRDALSQTKNFQGASGVINYNGKNEATKSITINFIVGGIEQPTYTIE